jgi:hypothetical protein
MDAVRSLTIFDGVIVSASEDTSIKLWDIDKMLDMKRDLYGSFEGSVKNQEQIESYLTLRGHQ